MKLFSLTLLFAINAFAFCPAINGNYDLYQMTTIREQKSVDAKSVSTFFSHIWYGKKMFVNTINGSSTYLEITPNVEQSPNYNISFLVDGKTYRTESGADLADYFYEYAVKCSDTDSYFTLSESGSNNGTDQKTNKVYRADTYSTKTTMAVSLDGEIIFNVNRETYNAAGKLVIVGKYQYIYIPSSSTTSGEQK